MHLTSTQADNTTFIFKNKYKIYCNCNMTVANLQTSTDFDIFGNLC